MRAPMRRRPRARPACRLLRPAVDRSREVRAARSGRRPSSRSPRRVSNAPLRPHPIGASEQLRSRRQRQVEVDKAGNVEERERQQRGRLTRCVRLRRVPDGGCGQDPCSFHEEQVVHDARAVVPVDVQGPFRGAGGARGVDDRRRIVRPRRASGGCCHRRVRCRRAAIGRCPPVHHHPRRAPGSPCAIRVTRVAVADGQGVRCRRRERTIRVADGKGEFGADHHAFSGTTTAPIAWAAQMRRTTRESCASRSRRGHRR